MSTKLFTRTEQGTFEQIATEHVVSVQLPEVNLTTDEAISSVIEAVEVTLPETQAILIGEVE
jgi:hypothetical protein